MKQGMNELIDFKTIEALSQLGLEEYACSIPLRVVFRLSLMALRGLPVDSARLSTSLS
jgi:hypothetical protein